MGMVKALMAVVDARGYSRICGAISEDSDTNRSGMAPRNMSPTMRSLSGLGVKVLPCGLSRQPIELGPMRYGVLPMKLRAVAT